jgi:hypothetical protein
VPLTGERGEPAKPPHVTDAEAARSLVSLVEQWLAAFFLTNSRRDHDMAKSLTTTM